MKVRNDKQLCSSPEGQISAVKFLPRSGNEENLLAVGSWDNAVRLYDFKQNVCKEYSTQAPVLGLAPTSPSSIVYGGLDNTLYVREVDVNEEKSKAKLIGCHEAPVCSVHYNHSFKLVLSAGWDSSIRLWDLAGGKNKQTKSINTEEKVLCMDVREHLVAAARADGSVVLWDLRNNNTHLKKTMVKDSLNIQCIGIFPSLKRLVYGTSEGKASIEALDEKDADKDFLFKPHVDKIKDIKHPVNAVCCIENSSKFLTCGSDGKVRLWDPDTKKLLTDFPQYPNQASAVDVKGRYAAVGCSYMDDRELDPNTEVPDSSVFVRDISQYIQ